MLFAASALTIGVLTLTAGGRESAPSEHQVERRLRAVAARAGVPLHAARCVRDEVFQRTFTCLVEAPFDWELAWRVRWLPGGELDIRRPDGTHVPL